MPRPDVRARLIECGARGRPARSRRGLALLVALAALTLLGAVALALHAVALRERRVARRAFLARAAGDAAEGALAGWQAALAAGDVPAQASVADPLGAVRVLQDGDAPAPGGWPSVHVRVALVALGSETRHLVAEARAAAGLLHARRRVALLLVPDSIVTPPPEGDTLATATVRRRWVAAPIRPWVDLP